MNRWWVGGVSRVGGARRGVYVFKRISKEIGKPADDRGGGGFPAGEPRAGGRLTGERFVGGRCPRGKCGEGLGVRARRYCTYACA